MSFFQNCKIWKLGTRRKHEQKINETKQHPNEPQALQQRYDPGSIIGNP